MGENTTIEWTDHTFNPWCGCTKVSAGCAHCYAETLSRRKLPGAAVWGPAGTRVVNSEQMWSQPPKWNARAAKTGIREKVFCASLADVFEDWNGPMLHSNGTELKHYSRGRMCGLLRDSDPDQYDLAATVTMSDVRRRLFALIDDTPHLDWQLVTKRPENIRRFWELRTGDSPSTEWDRNVTPMLRRNVWLLTSVENQEQADIRILELLKCRELAPVLGLSCEPLLEPVDLSDSCLQYQRPEDRCIDWVICGGESGPGARPMHPQWARSLRDQCQAAGVPFFFKQWGEFSPLPSIVADTHCQAAQMYQQITWNAHDETWRTPGRLGETALYRVGKKLAGRILDGREWNEMGMKGTG